jgi:large subunit ribosomal protein L10
MSVTVAKTYDPKKVQAIEQVKALAQQYKTIAAASLYKIREAQLMELRRSFRDRMVIKVVKNRLAKLALSSLNLKGIDAFIERLQGPNALIFTDMNPFELHLLLEKHRVEMPARAGDIATDDIVIPKGNTGLPPGPVLSEFKEAGVPTKIDAGSIWVVSDTVVAHKGEEITPKLAGLLARLELKPIRAGLSIRFAYHEGLIFDEKDLAIDLEGFRAELLRSQQEALGLAREVGYPAPEVLPVILVEASWGARRLAVEVGYPTGEVIADLLGEAVRAGEALHHRLKEKGYS